MTVRSGTASVKIYKVRTGAGSRYEAFAIADYGSGKRRLRKFSDLKTADDYYEAKKAQKAQGRASSHLSDITSRLGRFVHDHPGRNVGDFTSPMIQAWLDRLCRSAGDPLSAQSRRNFATILSGSSLSTAASVV